MKAKRVKAVIKDCFSRIQGNNNSFVPRHPQLCAWEGEEFTISSGINMRNLNPSLHLRFLRLCQCLDCKEVDILKNAYIGKMRLGKVLAILGFTEAEISQIHACKMPEVSLTLTCRYKDFLRMSKTRHFKTCFDGARKAEIFSLLRNPFFALLVHKDERGDFTHRCVVRLVCDTDNPEKLGLFTTGYYPYGFDVTHKNIPIYYNKSYPCRLVGKGEETYYGE